MPVKRPRDPDKDDWKRQSPNHGKNDGKVAKEGQFYLAMTNWVLFGGRFHRA